MKKNPLVLCSLTVAVMFACSVVFAEQTKPADSSADQVQKVYKTVGPNGQVIYSDKPSPGSEEVTVPTGGGYKPVAPPAGFTPYQAPARNPPKQPVNNTVSISSPTDQETIWSAPGDLSVTVNLASPLGPGQTLEYQIDGKTVYTGSETSHAFSNIDRGTHVVTVRITDEAGGSVTSQPVTVYLKRPFKQK